MFDSGIFVGLITVVLVGIGISLYVNKVRHERFGEAARQRGWTYHKKLNSMRRQVVEDVRGGRSGNAFVSVFEGSVDGQQFFAGTAQWTETSGSGDNRRTETFKRKVLTRPIPLRAPRMRLEKEGFLKNIFNRDIKTEWEVFNKTWIITGDDPRFVSAVLSPTMQQWLMDHTDYHFALRSGWITVFTGENRMLQVDDVDGFLAASTGFCDEIASFIWQDYGTGSSR